MRDKLILCRAFSNILNCVLIKNFYDNRNSRFLIYFRLIE